MEYEEPVAELLDISRDRDVTTTVVELDRVPSEPVAPAGLYDRQDPGRKMLELHKVVDRTRNVLTFESYDVEHDLLSKGERFIFRSWWIPDAMELVMNTGLVWSREVYPDDGSHAHCELTYETISAYTGHREGYRSGNAWITVEAYEQFIRGDALRIRGENRA